MNYSIVKQYLANQKIKVVEDYDFENKRVKYSEKIKGWKIDKFRGDEEVVRAFLLSKLANELGYKSENIELEKQYDIGRPKVNKPRIDIIVRDNNGNAFLYIELKAPEEFEKDKDEVIEKQLFNLASQEKGQGKNVKYLVLYTFEIINEEIKDKCIIIDYEKFTSFESWKEVRDFADQIPAYYGKAQKDPYVKGGKKDLEKNFAPEQLDALRKNLHNVLWGGGGTDDNDIFSSLVNIILAKIQDESEKKKGEQYDFQIFESKDGESFETNEQLFERINQLYRRALKQRLNILDENKLNKSFVVDENKFSLNKLKYVVSELERFSFVDGKNSFNGKDILGDFFEGIIREGFKQTKGQFFTHINIVKFILWALQLDKLAIDRVNNDLEIPYLIDPSAGSGTFLIEYMKFITDNLKRRFRDRLHENRDVEDKFNEWFLPDHRENKWAREYIYGIEINFNLGTATKVNMILHGDGSSNIFVKDGLLPFKFYDKETAPNFLKQYDQDRLYFDKEVNGQFDVVVSNPPFSVDLDKETQKTIKDGFLFGDKKNSENLFVERWYQLLKPNGRLGVVLPESVFDTTENKYIRLFIYKYFKVKAVVSLPQLTFEPFTSTKTSLLFAQKKTKEEIEKWNELWTKYSNEWNKLKTRCENLMDVYLEEKDRQKLSSIKDLTESDEKQILTRMLKNYIEEGDQNLSPKEIIQKYKDELKELCKYDNDTKDFFGFVNTWWVFGEVAKELNYKIFMAEVENIGYKRTKRGEKPMPNELYREGEITYPDGSKHWGVLVDDGRLETVLDYMRLIDWDGKKKIIEALEYTTENLKIFYIDFVELAKHLYVRFDEKFWYTTKNLVVYNYILLKDVFNLVNGNSYTEYYTEEKTSIPFIRVGDLTFKFEIDDTNLIYLDDSVELSEDKILKYDDLILATIGATIGKINLARNFKGGTFSNNTILLRLKDKKKHNPLFYEKLLQSNLLQKYIWGVVSQKAQPNLQVYDLENIKIPLIPKEKQDQIVAQIAPIEQKIKQLKSIIKDPQEIINEVFAREFGFDKNLYNKFGKGMTAGTQIAEERKLRVFEVDFKELSRSKILRFSTRFHNPPTKELMDILDKIKTVKIKDVLLETIHRGVTPKYNSNGEIPVIKTNHLKNGYIEISQEEFVDTDFYKKSIKSQVKKGDILIASTGKGSLGKIDLLEEQKALLADSHISIVRIDDKKYSRQFFIYFFRCILGYFQIERDYTGTTNQIELYAEEISNFQIPNIPLSEQQRIVDEIKAELDKQEEIKKQIEEERKKIDEIVERAVLD